VSRPMIAAGVALLAIGVATPARACAVHAPLNLAAARNADVVVIGRVSGYRGGGRNSGGFNVAVDEVLSGRAARMLRVGLEPGLGGRAPALLRGRVLMALRRSSPQGGLTVIQHICSDPFILDASSARARTVRGMLGRRR
jgi:hypothetical protein